MRKLRETVKASYLSPSYFAHRWENGLSPPLKQPAPTCDPKQLFFYNFFRFDQECMFSELYSFDIPKGDFSKNPLLRQPRHREKHLNERKDSP